MSLLDEDIIRDFQSESRVVLGELQIVVAKLDDAAPAEVPQLLSDFAQKIDRIMGAAKTLSMMDPSHMGLTLLSKLSETCKSLGYKAAAKNDPALTPHLAAFWEEVLEVVEALLDKVNDPAASNQIATEQGKTVVGRLDWILSKVA